MARGGAREIATQAGRGVEQFAHQVFEMTARFVDPGNPLDHTRWLIQLPNDLVENSADLFQNTLIGRVLWINRQDLLAGRVLDHFREWKRAQLLILLQQPGNDRINRIG